MGFKRVNIKDLETSMTPAFLGLPLKHIEERELLKVAQKEQKLKKESNVFLLNEEILEYNYDKNGIIQNFIGSGNITILNNSEKDRIWDAKLILSGTQNTNVQSEDAIRLGNFEPKSNKVINYSIVEYEELPDPVKVTELIEVLDLNTEKIDLMQHEISVEAEEDEIITQKVPEKIKIKDLDLLKSEKIKKEKITNLEKDEEFLKKEVDNEFDPKIENLNLKLDNEREVLEEINKELKEYATKGKKQNNTINSLKKNYESLLKAKNNALNKRLKQFSKDANNEKHPEEHESLLNDIKIQISEIEENITKIEEKYSKQEDIIKKDVDDEYNPQINNIESELSIRQEDLNETTENITDWNEKRKNLSEIIKNLKKKHKSLPPTKTIIQGTKLKETDEEEPSIKEIESQIKIKEEEIKKIEEEYLKKEATIKNEVENEYNSQIKRVDSKIAEQKSLDETIKNVNELNEKKKELTNSIKTIKRDHETLIKTKSKKLSTRLKKTPIDNEFEKKVEKEVDNEFDPQIKSLESELNAKQKNLDDIIKNFNQWSTKKNESSVIVKNLKKEHENLLKTKSKELRTRLKALLDKEKAEKEIEDDYLKKEATAKKEIDNEFEPQIENIDSKLSIEQKNLDGSIENVNEWSAKKTNSSEILKNLKKEHEKLLKTKSKALNKKLQEMRLKGISIDDDSEKKLEKEIDNEFEPQIKSVDSKLSVEQENLDESIKNVNEWIAKKNELNDNVKNLNKERKNILKIKSKALNTRLKKTTGIDEFSKKAEKEVNDEFNPKIESMESELNAKQKILDDITKNFNEWSAKKDESSTIAKNLKKEYENLIKAKSKELRTRLKAIPDEEKTEEEIEEDILKKETSAKKEIDNEFDPQIKSLELKLNAEQKNLDDIIKKIDDLNEKRYELSNSIKIIKKEPENLLKNKTITLNTRLKENIEEKKIKIEGIKNQINKKQAEITKFKKKPSKKVDSIETEVKDKSIPQIESVDAELNVQKENLNEVIKKINDWTIKKKEVKENIRYLKSNQKNLLKEKSKAFSKRLEELNKEKETELDEFRGQKKAKQEDLKKIEEGSSIIDASMEKEVEIEYKPKINSAKSKLDVEQKNLEKIIKKIDDLTNEKNELITNIKDLEKTRKSILKAKSKALSKKLKGKEIIEKKPDLDKKDDEITRVKEEYSKKEDNIKKEVGEEFNPQINSINSRLNIEQENLDDVIKNVNEWNTKKNEFSNVLKNLKKDHKTLLKTTSKAPEAELKKAELKKSDEKEPSIEKIKIKINMEEEEIEKIEEEYLKKEAIIKNKVENEFYSQLKSLDSKSSAEQKNLDVVIKKINELNEKKKNLSNSIKTIKKEHENLLKTKSKELSTRLRETPIDEESSKRVKKGVEDEFDPQIKSLESKLNAEQKNLDEAIKNINELNEKKKKSNDIVKNLKKEHETLLRTKSKELRTRLKAIPDKERTEKVMEKDTLKKEIITKNEIDNEFDSQIKSFDSQLSTEQKNLDEAIENINEWIQKKNKLSDIAKNLKKENETLLKTKSKALNKKLQEMRLKGITIDDETLKKLENEIENEYISKIKSLDSKLITEQKNLDEAIKNINEWTAKKNNLSNTTKNLNKERKNLLKAKSKSLSMRVKKIPETDEFSRKVEKEVEDEFDSQIKSLELKLNAEQKNLDEIIKNINEWTTKKNESSTIVKNLRKEHETLLKTKSKALNTRLKAIPDKEKTESVLEKDTLKEEIIIRKEIDNEFDSQIKSIESKLNAEQKNLDEVIKKVNELNEKKKELSNSIKIIEKEHEKLLKTKSKTQSVRLKEIIKEKKIKIKEIRSQISEKEEDITKIKKKPSKKVDSLESEVKYEDLTQITSVESELRVKREILDDAIKNLNEWNEKRKKLNQIIKDLKNKEKKILKTKSKALNTRLKEIYEEKKININEIKEEIKTKKTAEPEIKETEKIHEDEAVSESSAIDVISSKAKEKEIKKGEAEVGHELDKLDVQNNLILLYNQLNTLKFTIKLENTTKYTMENIRIGKVFSEDFLNFKYESKTISNVEFIKNNIICTLKELKPKEKADIVIFADINPKEKKLIGTGRIQLSYNYKDYLISGINFENFTAYSHAMHAIKIKEKEIEANQWICSLLFKNNSDLDMELYSVLVLDNKKENKYIDLDFSSDKEKHLIKPGEKFISKEWNIKDENEPKFFRKLGYSVTHRIDNDSKINIKFEEDIFDIVDLDISKRFSETEIKSFEEDVIECIINIKNIGTIPIQGLKIIDLVPEDFLPPIEFSDYQLRISTGRRVFGDINLKIRPNNQDHTVPHKIEIKINSERISDNILDVNEFLEVKYKFKVISPSYQKKYDYKLDINSYFLKEKINPENYYFIENSLSKNKQPVLNVIHKRRDLLISKEIFPGRTVDEFVINILINNNSNIELNNIEIKDTISKSFELVSSNITYSESDEGNDITLSFNVDRILPYQETEIRYYVMNKSGKKVDYDELESFIFG